MYKCTILVTYFQKNLQAQGALRPQRPLTFNIGEPKFRDMAKLYFFKLITYMTKSNFKNSYDVISVTSSQLRHRKTSPK